MCPMTILRKPRLKAFQKPGFTKLNKTNCITGQQKEGMTVINTSLHGHPDQSVEFTLRSVGSIHEIDARVWNSLNESAGGGILSSHAFLSAFEQSASVCPATGWQPHHLLLEIADQPVAVLAMYAKGHSYGEFVFDWAWAQAYERHGLRYYPKWLGAIPFTPVSGPRLLCKDALKPAVAQALLAWAKASPLSSMHLLYTSELDQQALTQEGFLARKHTQFHWFNQGWESFDEFLASLSQSKRKKIRAERRRVAQTGIHTKVLAGSQIGQAEWDFFYSCYANTYAMRGNPPYLTPDFFKQIAQSMPQACLMVIAYDGQRPLASALSWLDLVNGQRRLYGRYWGCLEHVDCLHFEVAYYSAIEWAIDHQISVIEGGAQGQHKMARGFIPVHTYSAHWLAHPGFFDAVDEYLKQETRQVEQYTDSLESPYKHDLPGLSE